MQSPQYSVVIPVFNSADTLENLYLKTRDYFDKDGKSFEMILVDDHSKDNSWSMIQELKKQDPERIRGIRLSKNYGQHSALMCGFRQVKGNFIVTIDDDLQHDPSDISKLISRQAATNSDVVYGISPDHKKGIRKNGSKIWKFLSRNVNEGLGEGSSFRLIKSELIEKVSLHNHYFVFIDELLHWYTGSVEFISVPHYERMNGKSGYTPRKLMSFTANLIVFYSSFPLRLMTYSGIIFSLISFLAGLFFIVKKVFFKIEVPGFTALMVSLLFSSGILLLCFGIVGEYLSRIYSVLNSKPSFSIKESI